MTKKNLFKGIIDPECPSCRVIIEYLNENEDAELQCILTRDSTYMHLTIMDSLPDEYQAKLEYTWVTGEYPE